MNNDMPTSEERLLSAEDIFGADDLEPVTIYVPEWKGNVRIRPLSATETFEFVEASKKNTGSGAVVLLAMCAVDANGNQLFSADDLNQRKRLGKKSLKAIMRLQKIAMDLNGLSDNSKAEAAKND